MAATMTMTTKNKTPELFRFVFIYGATMGEGKYNVIGSCAEEAEAEFMKFFFGDSKFKLIKRKKYATYRK